MSRGVRCVFEKNIQVITKMIMPTESIVGKDAQIQDQSMPLHSLSIISIDCNSPPNVIVFAEPLLVFLSVLISRYPPLVFLQGIA